MRFEKGENFTQLLNDKGRYMGLIRNDLEPKLVHLGEDRYCIAIKNKLIIHLKETD